MPTAGVGRSAGQDARAAVLFLERGMKNQRISFAGGAERLFEQQHGMVCSASFCGLMSCRARADVGGRVGKRKRNRPLTEGGVNNAVDRLLSKERLRGGGCETGTTAGRETTRSPVLRHTSARRYHRTYEVHT